MNILVTDEMKKISNEKVKKHNKLVKELGSLLGFDFSEHDSNLLDESKSYYNANVVLNLLSTVHDNGAVINYENLSLDDIYDIFFNMFLYYKSQDYRPEKWDNGYSLRVFYENVSYTMKLNQTEEDAYHNTVWAYNMPINALAEMICELAAIHIEEHGSLKTFSIYMLDKNLLRIYLPDKNDNSKALDGSHVPTPSKQPYNYISQYSNINTLNEKFIKLSNQRFFFPFQLRDEFSDLVNNLILMLTLNYGKKDDNIKHDGLKGMKWGVRRYQNEDGTLTDEGKIRYGSDVKEFKKNNPGMSKKDLENYVTAKYYSEKQAKLNTVVTIGTPFQKATVDIGKQMKEPEIKGSKVIKKKYPELSTEELDKRVRRINLEEKYSDLTGDTKYVKTGKDKIREILQSIGTGLSIALTAATLASVFANLKANKAASKIKK